MFRYVIESMIVNRRFKTKVIYLVTFHSDIKFGAWEATQCNVLRRSSSYTMRLTYPIGPKSTKCFFEDECQHCDYDNYVTTVITTTTPDVPQGNCFVVKTRLCIMWAGANEVRVIV